MRWRSKPRIRKEIRRRAKWNWRPAQVRTRFFFAPNALSIVLVSGSNSRCFRSEIEAKDQEGNQASSKVELEARAGEDQILLRTERAVYRAGERIQLKVF